jgi:monomeric isocitrate dehydrogenase
MVVVCLKLGTGGSAPKHVEQLQKKDTCVGISLGEFKACRASLEHLGQTYTIVKQLFAESLLM